jgi:catechol 2,3-dioxygenase
MQIQELGHVVLYVIDLERSANFYRDTLGFQEVVRQSGMAMFSSGRTHHELLLIEIGGTVREKHFPEPGLYHIGFKIGDSTDDVRRAKSELEAAGVRMVGMADHGMTHSLYLLDPDGNELELYADVDDHWKKDATAALRPTRPLAL